MVLRHVDRLKFVVVYVCLMHADMFIYDYRGLGFAARFNNYLEDYNTCLAAGPDL